MAINEKLIEIRDYTGEGYKPLIDFGAWRVAVLNFSDDLLPENLNRIQRHNETDEVFDLLCGQCVLFLAEGDETATQIYAENMQPGRIYNVKKGVWHTHTLSRNAKVLIVENRDTTYDNSPFCNLSDSQQNAIMELSRKFGKTAR